MEAKPTELYSVKGLEIPYSLGDGGASIAFEGALFDFVEGKAYIVVWNWTTYETTAALVDSFMPGIVVGNHSIWGGDDTGEPFAFVFFSSPEYGSATLLQVMNSTADVTADISVSAVVETIHPINPKYLPKGGFGYEEGGKTLLDTALESGLTLKLGHIGLEVGKTYVVVTDSGSYEAVGKAASDPNIKAYIGNGAQAGEADTGETFSVIDGYDEDLEIFLCSDANSGTRMTIKTAETIHPINPKFLPKGGVGYDDSCEGGATWPADPTEEDIAAFMESERCLTAVDIPYPYGYLLTTKTPEKGTASIHLDVSGAIVKDLSRVETGDNYSVYVDDSKNILLFVIYTAGDVDLGDDFIVSAPQPGVYWVGNYMAGEFTVSWRAIHTIDPKFIPGVCLPVVELSTDLSIDADATELSAEEQTKMDAVSMNGAKYILVDASFSKALFGRATFVLTHTNYQGVVVFSGFVGSVYIAIVQEEGVWKAMIVREVF